MRQILTLLFLVFVFFGCTPKQVVELKLPDKQPIKEKVVPKNQDTTTIVEEFTPIDIKESDNVIKESTPQSDNSNTTGQTIEPVVNTEPVINNQNIQIDVKGAKIQIAFIYPSKLVEKYAKGSLNTISGYLSYQNADYNLVVIDSENESSENIRTAFSKVNESGITNVIAMFTPNAIGTLNQVVSNNLKVYLPLIEKKDSLGSNDNLIFGSISYDEQLKKLSYYSSGKNAMFYQDTYLGMKLKRTYDSLMSDNSVQKLIKKDETNFKGIVDDYRLNNSSLFLNTDIVKTSLILSQLRSYEINPKLIFGTQVAYDPMIMVLTQEKDRERLVIANSIDDVNSKLKDEIAIFGGNITYEWVDYSTLVGINYLYNGGNSSLISTQIVDNQVVYTPRLFKSTEIGFLEIK